jgi:hypothetical protein
MRAADEWCSQCLTQVERERTFAHPDAFLGPPSPKGYSRTVKGATTFGALGRIVATLLLVVIPTAWLLYYAFPFGVVYVVAAGPLFLSAIWKKTPIPADPENSER